MKKTILITGSTDGIGLATARQLQQEGHEVLLHGRNPNKLEKLKSELGLVGFVADFSKFEDVRSLADSVIAHGPLDIVINNAGVLRMADARTESGLDARFVVNTLAPYLLTRSLLPVLAKDGRVVNLSSAAQAPVNLRALQGEGELSDSEAYAQSKLALTMWSRHLADELGPDGPVIVAVNPKSFLGSKMVKDAYGVDGSDLSVGADILARAALSDEFAGATGLYFDNDIGRFSQPHPDALDTRKNARLVKTIEQMLEDY
ncbi:SDR family NAD(P)-dependent oxidoreductase [Roseibacillus persicicus]|uniref:SDR family NAD(P)-dependent oxidoreductase n=1 Tax=Roseibacillus persicicus TaxID=454148 RepID=UPI00280EFD6A|nr:SDR family NAD(P)-dependent oxidoreductase [Roseibacillus persicicus]MDQ8190305.1 SDR family NAD(P)-dependent oxidoreductase [Roseibacillus persicicus]